MEWVHGLTPYAGGFAAPGTTGGTAVGVCACMTAAAEHVFGTADLAGLGATVVGLGGVGELLARRAAENGATLTVTDRAAEFSAGACASIPSLPDRRAATR
jgi:glutamate dehydrogenase/leucine dehydrogenase